jgi:hypothetical protein
MKITSLDLLAIFLGVIFALIAVPNFRKAREPVLYLYPTSEQKVSVKLSIDGKLTAAIPDYKDSWELTASPDGSLIFGNATFPHLFYEADLIVSTVPEKGWTINKSDLEIWMSKTLKDLGFIEKEINDFKSYWLRTLSTHETYDAFLLPEKFVTSKLGLTITPKPDTLIRALFYFRKGDKDKKLTPPEIITPSRNGFVAAEWGGILE